jgi:purine-binding chemotaxis protein CheW
MTHGAEAGPRAQNSASAQQVARDGERVEMLLFELATQRFAIAAADVFEVVRAVALRALPNAPPVVEGIINLRGEAVPVLDIRARFGLQPKTLELTDHFLIVSAEQRRVALRVDRALMLCHLPALSIERAINLPRGVDHVSGVAVLDDELVLLHDLHAFLSEVEARQLARALLAVPEAEERSA